MPQLNGAVCVLILESNLGFEAQHLMHAIQAAKLPRWLVLTETSSGAPGWETTHARKETMCIQVRDALKVGCVGAWRGFTSRSFDTTKEALDQLADELRNFCVIVTPPPPPFGKTTRTYSGKVGGRQDDLSMAFQLAGTGMRAFFSSTKYNSYKPTDF